MSKKQEIVSLFLTNLNKIIQDELSHLDNFSVKSANFHSWKKVFDHSLKISPKDDTTFINGLIDIDTLCNKYLNFKSPEKQLTIDYNRNINENKKSFSYNITDRNSTNNLTIKPNAKQFLVDPITFNNLLQQVLEDSLVPVDSISWTIKYIIDEENNEIIFKIKKKFKSKTNLLLFCEFFHSYISDIIQHKFINIPPPFHTSIPFNPININEKRRYEIKKISSYN